MRRKGRHAAALAVALVVALTTSGCLRTDDSAAIRNHYDHPVEYWTVWVDGTMRDHLHGTIPPGQDSPLTLRDCLHPAERIQIRHPDGRVLQERAGLCRGDRWDGASHHRPGGSQ